MMQLVQFQATRYVAVITLTLVHEAGDGRVQLFVTPLASLSAVVTGLVVLLAGLADLAGRLGNWLAGLRIRLLVRAQALHHRAVTHLTLAGILGRALAWALLDV